MNKPQKFTCVCCGVSWVGPVGRCPNSCDAIAKSEGEYTKKTLQGEDTDLKKGGW